MKKIIAFKDVKLDKGLQSRAKGLDTGHVGDLMLAYKGPNAETVESPRVFEIIGRTGYWLTRGFHRVEAMTREGKTRTEFDVRSGTFADAVIDAVQGNIGHGLKRTSQDKRRCVEMLLDIHPEWTDRAIAEKADVGHPLVAEVRAQVEDLPPESEESKGKTQKRLGRDGKRHPAKKEADAESEKPKIYPHDDGIPELPGVYTPLFMRNENGHEVCLDAHRNPAPDRVGDIFADPVVREKLAKAIAAAEAFEALYQGVMSMTRSPNFPFLDIPKLQLFAKRIRDTSVEFADLLREAVPHIVCPKCSGAGGQCKPCRMSGYIAKGLYDLSPEYQKLKRAV